MHTTLYRDGNGAAYYGSGFPAPYSANGSEPEITSQGTTYHPTRSAVDLSGCNDVRIACNLVSDISGPAPSVTLSLEYWDPTAAQGAGAWQSASASVTVSGAGLTVGSWVALPQGAQGDVQLRVVVSDETGNGGATVTPLSITLDARA